MNDWEESDEVVRLFIQYKERFGEYPDSQWCLDRLTESEITHLKADVWN